MNVTFGSGQSNITNVHRINQSIVARNGNRGSEQLSKTERGDSVTISPAGKRNSLLEQLMKQKTNINDQKNSLIILSSFKDEEEDNQPLNCAHKNTE